MIDAIDRRNARRNPNWLTLARAHDDSELRLRNPLTVLGFFNLKEIHVFTKRENAVMKTQLELKRDRE